jgi:hypothetical protein
VEFEAPLLGAEHFGAGEIRRQQVRCELHAREVGIQARSERADRTGFRQARRPFDKQMTVRKQRDEQALDQRRLTDDLGGERFAQCGETGRETRYIVGETVHGRVGSGAECTRAKFDRSLWRWFRARALRSACLHAEECPEKQRGHEGPFGSWVVWQA